MLLLLDLLFFISNIAFLYRSFTLCSALELYLLICVNLLNETVEMFFYLQFSLTSISYLLQSEDKRYVKTVAAEINKT